MKKTAFIGIDVSKKTLDVAICTSSEDKMGRDNSRQVTNDKDGFERLLSWWRGKGLDVGSITVCMENTEAYSKALCRFLQDEGVDCREENPLQIKRSIGMTRGKDDKAGAWRTAICCHSLRDNFRPMQLPDEALRTLCQLRAERKQLVRERAKHKAIANDGTAPFACQSGTSIHWRPHVSSMAAKEIKAELSQAALSAIRTDAWQQACRGQASGVRAQRRQVKTHRQSICCGEARHTLCKYLRICRINISFFPCIYPKIRGFPLLSLRWIYRCCGFS